MSTTETTCTNICTSYLRDPPPTTGADRTRTAKIVSTGPIFKLRPVHRDPPPTEARDRTKATTTASPALKNERGRGEWDPLHAEAGDLKGTATTTAGPAFTSRKAGRVPRGTNAGNDNCQPRPQENEGGRGEWDPLHAEAGDRKGTATTTAGPAFTSR